MNRLAQRNWLLVGAAIALIVPIPTAVMAMVRDTAIAPAVQTHPHPPQFLAQQSRVRRIKFRIGENSAMLKDAVIRGTRDIYLLGASRGQTMTIKLSSLENNAEFDLLSPSNKSGVRRLLQAGSLSWTGVLPTSGDYQIVVGSSRGNASYQLQVTIR
jgi:hypothetical protein